MENFIKRLQLDNKSQNTIDSYCYRLKEYFNFSNNQITQHTLDQYILYKKQANSSTNLFLSALKKYCKYNKINLDFPEQRKKEYKLRSYINEDELYNKYLNRFNELFNNYNKQKLIFKVLFYTGLRKSELVKLSRRDFDFNKKEIYVIDTKTKHDRTIPISKKIINDVKKYFTYNEEINNAFNINRYQVDYIFRIINKKFNLKDILTPHSLRRSFARYYYFDVSSEKGKRFDVADIQIMLGHTNLKQTLEYLQISSNDVMNKAREINV